MQHSTCTELTSVQLELWRAQGYLKVPNLFDADTIAMLERSIASIESLDADPDDSNATLHYYEAIANDRAKTRSERFLGLDPWLDGFILNSNIAAVLQQLFGEPAVLFKEKINYKYPDGGGFIPHQDAAAYDFVDYHITCLVAPQPTTEENGCLYFAAGEHKQGLLPMNSRRCIDSSALHNLRWCAVPSSPTDALFFGSYTPHFSNTNKTQTARKALYLTYNAASLGDFRSQYYQHRNTRLTRAAEQRANQISTIQHFDGRTDN